MENQHMKAKLPQVMKAVAPLFFGMKFLLVLTLVLVSAGAASAQVDGTYKAGISHGNWSDPTKWTGDPSPVPGGAGSTVNLTTGNGGSVFVLIDGTVASRTVGTVNFDGISPWTVASAVGGGTLTMDNSGTSAQVNVASTNTGNARIIAPLILGSSLVATNNSATVALELTGGISDTGGPRSITKNGTGSLSLGAGANTFSGGFILNDGAVRTDNNAGFGSGTLTLNGGSVLDTGASRFYTNALVLGGNVTFAASSGGSTILTGTTTLTGSRVFTVDPGVDTHFAGNITESGTGFSITKNGTGTLSLGRSGEGGSNVYSGGFILNAGTLRLGGGSGVNTQFGTGTVTINGGSLGSESFARTLTNNFTYNADLVIASTSNRIDFNGTGTLTGNRTFALDTTTTVYNGAIGESGGSYSLTKTGVGTLWLDTAAHTYTGGLIMEAGQINVGGSSTLSAAGNVTVNGGTLNIATHTNAVGAVFINGGTISNTSGGGILSSSLGFTATAGNINAILAGSGTFTKNGAGTATFGFASNNQNTYTGATIVDSGTLALGVSNRIADAGALTVNGGAFSLLTFNDQVGVVTLAGGSITSTTGTLTASSYAFQSGSASAILAGSATALTKTTSGTATLSGVNTYTGSTTVDAGTLALSDNAELRFSIGSSGVNNQVNGSGTLTIDGDFRFNLASAGTTEGNIWNIVTVGTLSETFGGTFSVFSTNGAFNNNGGGIWTRTENSVNYQFSQATGNLLVVPEPSTLLMLGLGSMLVLYKGRRRSLIS